MNTTSSQLPVCVHCGTPRPADETLCPQCGKPWIDTTIKPTPASDETPPPAATRLDAEDKVDADSDVTTAAAVAGAATVGTASASLADDQDSGDTATAHDDSDPTDGVDSGDGGIDDTATNETPVVVPPPPAALGPDDTGEFAFDLWSEPVEDEPQRRGTAWLVPAGLAAAVLAVIAFLVFSGGEDPTTTTVAALNTTVPQTPTTVASAATTTQAPTTTAVAFPSPADWPATGEPIAITDLTLKQSAIGPLDFGMPIADAAGALTASLGEASGSGVDGLCPPDESYWLQFGQLTAIFDGFDSTSVFVSYRYDEPAESDPDLGLKTLSGIAIGDTVEDLINTYTQFTISFEIIDSKDHFRLSDGGELLLWGPVSSVDPAGLIEGIYSPTACDATP